MLLPDIRVAHHIIKICSGVGLMGPQHDVHQVLEDCWCPMEAQGENLVLPVTHCGAESCFGSRYRGEGNWPVAFNEVEGGDELGFPQMLDEIMHLGYGVAVKLRDLVQFPEIVAQLQTSIGLGNHDDGAGPGTGRPRGPDRAFGELPLPEVF